MNMWSTNRLLDECVKVLISFPALEKQTKKTPSEESAPHSITAAQGRHVLPALPLPVKCSGSAASVLHRQDEDLGVSQSHTRDPIIQRLLKTKHSPSGVHKGLFSSIKGITLVFQHFEMLILFSKGFSSSFQHETPRGNNNRKTSNKSSRFT